MFSSLEAAIKWAEKVLKLETNTDIEVCTYLPVDADSPAPDTEDKKFCIVERAGGQLDYPHDSPEISFQMWSQYEVDAESLAHTIAIAAKNMPPADRHINAVGVPSVCSYTREKGGWFVWQTTIPFEVNLLD